MDVISIDEFWLKLEGVIKGAHLIPNFTVHFCPLDHLYLQVYCNKLKEVWQQFTFHVI